MGRDSSFSARALKIPQPLVSVRVSKKKVSDQPSPPRRPARGTVALHQGTPVYITEDATAGAGATIGADQVIVSAFDRTRTVHVVAWSSLRAWDPNACNARCDKSTMAFDEASSFIHRYPSTDGRQHYWRDLGKSGHKEELLCAKMRGFFLEARLRGDCSFTGILLTGGLQCDRTLLAQVAAQTVDRAARESGCFGGKGVDFMRYTARELSDEVVMRSMLRYMTFAYTPLLVWIDDLDALLPNETNDSLLQRKGERLTRVLCEGCDIIRKRDGKSPPVMLVGTSTSVQLVHPEVQKKGRIDCIIQDELEV